MFAYYKCLFKFMVSTAIVSIGLIIAGSLILSDHTGICGSRYNCHSVLIFEPDGAETCSSEIIGLNLTIRRSCREWEGCFKIYCPEEHFCYYSWDKLTLGLCHTGEGVGVVTLVIGVSALTVASIGTVAIKFRQWSMKEAADEPLAEASSEEGMTYVTRNRGYEQMVQDSEA